MKGTGPAGAWCALYTLAVPEADRARRREEIAAHVWDSVETWGRGARTWLRIVSASARGVLHDVAWCNEIRKARGLAPLAVAAVGPTGGTLVAGVLIVAAYLCSLIPTDLTRVVQQVTGLAALAVMCVSLTLRVAARRRRRGP